MLHPIEERESSVGANKLHHPEAHDVIAAEMEVSDRAPPERNEALPYAMYANDPINTNTSFTQPFMQSSIKRRPRKQPHRSCTDASIVSYVIAVLKHHSKTLCGVVHNGSHCQLS
jgi:hypothetical protein